jgi:hypothetical protein
VASCFFVVLFTGMRGTGLILFDAVDDVIGGFDCPM